MRVSLLALTSAFLRAVSQGVPPGTNLVLLQDMMFFSGLPPTNTSSGSGAGGGGGQQVALASYIDPLGDPTDWARLINYPTDKLGILVANVVNGPDSVTNSGWQNVIEQATATGKTVLGYVRTGYLGVSQQNFATRLNSHMLSDWTAQIETDVDTWYQLYPDTLGGIFFDEGWNDCGTNNEYSELYAYITQNTKRKHPHAYTVLNPGAGMPSCFENSADTLLLSEVSYDDYLNSYEPIDWTPLDDRKIWHITYGVPDGQGPAVAALAKERGAGLIEITDGVQPNPYDTLPTDEYLDAVFGAISGGSPLVGGYNGGLGGPTSLGAPAEVEVVTFDYSSVSLSWSPVANAAGYRIYGGLNDDISQALQVLDLPATMTNVQFGGLVPGTSSYTFQVGTVGGDGNDGQRAQIFSPTLALPTAGAYLNNANVNAQSASTTYSIDSLVPYGFVTIFIYGDVDNEECAGWPVSFTLGDFVCAIYMVQSDILYAYTGAAGTFLWSWLEIAAAPSTQDDYTITWTVPIGTSTLDTGNFVVQGTGYNPEANVFVPCVALGGLSVTLANSHCEEV